MKPTNEQMTVLTVAHCSGRTLYDAIMATIEYWEKSIRPKDDTDRWIPLTERLPTEEDADENGEVLVFFRDRSFAQFSWQIVEGVTSTHWRRTNLPPKELTAEEIERAELGSAWAEYSGNAPHGSLYSDFTSGWKAARNKFNQTTKL